MTEETTDTRRDQGAPDKRWPSTQRPQGVGGTGEQGHGQGSQDRQAGGWAHRHQERKQTAWPMGRGSGERPACPAGKQEQEARPWPTGIRGEPVPTFPRGALTSFSTPGARRGLSPNHPQPLPSLTPSYPGAKTRKACQGTGPGHLGLQAWVVLGLGVGTEALWGREGSCLRSLRTLGGVTLHLDFCGLLMAAAPPSQPTILSLGVRGSETPHSHISTLPKVPRADGGTDDGGGGS